MKDRIKKFWGKLTKPVKNLKLYPLFLISLSLLILNYTSKEGHTYQDLFKEVGIALFIVGAITIMLELGDFTEYFLERLKETMIEDDYLDDLDPDKLDGLKKKIEAKLYFKDNIHENDFFYAVQEDIVPLLKGPYYDKYEIKIECTVEGKYIKKIVYKTVEIANPNKKPITITVPIEVFMNKIDGVKDEDLFKVNSLLINGNPKEVSCDITKEVKDERYDIGYTCNYSVIVEDKTTIDIETETIVPIDDLHYVHKVAKPCKNYEIDFTLYNKEYVVTGYGFGFMDQKKLKKRRTTRGLSISFQDWILPGDGAIFTISKKIDDI